MGILIGMDEAGYGPNFGPLVVTATVWEVPDAPRDIDLWARMAEAIERSPSAGGERLHIADSKQVYTPARGLGALERGVLCALHLCGCKPGGLRALWRAVAGDDSACANEPWFADADLPLPHAVAAADCGAAAETWRRCCTGAGVRLKAIRSEIVLTRRFNELIRACDSKGLALSRLSLRLLRRVWQPDDSRPARVIADKHGGRNRYDLLLSEILDGQMVLRQEESRDRSVYRVGATELRFQTRAEEHLPVAVASMVSKYLRELAMLLFNRYWCERVPGLKPTAGYPADALRFRREIAAAQAEIGISNENLWRNR
jgi:hypothetical protein